MKRGFKLECGGVRLELRKSRAELEFDPPRVVAADPVAALDPPVATELCQSPPDLSG